MANIETTHLISRYMNQKAQQLKNNNNEPVIRVSSPPFINSSVTVSIASSDAQPLPQSTESSPTNPTQSVANCEPTGNSSSPARNSLSPSSVSCEAMSPPVVEQQQQQPPSSQQASNGYHYSGSYQSNFVNSVSYTTNLQPKKSFCIDALLSKTKANGNYSPPSTQRNDDDGMQSYADDRREYTSSPEDGMSR